MTGIICLNKHEDITSFWAVKQTLKAIGEKKGGHTGTLDPFATGVLPIALGRATRFIELLPSSKKGYHAKIQLGVTTDTLDITGEVISKTPVSVSAIEVEQLLEDFKGTISQLPPMFSAVRKDGVRLYDLARKGENVERDERLVSIFKLQLLSLENDVLEVYVECSAGTYIRALADDIGAELGCGAVLKELCRTRANGFSLEECVTLEELRNMDEDEIKAHIIPVDKALDKYEALTVTDAQAKRFRNGGELLLDRLECSGEIGYYRLYSPENAFLGVGEIAEGSNIMSVKRVFCDE
jgi:tRNA pseudouridine55 synthase